MVDKMDIGIASISSKGQIVIPQNIRKGLELRKNDQLIFISENNEIVLKPVREVLNIKRKKSRFAEEFIKAMRHEKILTEMEHGRELSAEEVLR